MSDQTVNLTIDGVRVTASKGATIMEAADAAGVYIPRLCDHEGLRHQGSCRVCTVKAGGRSVAACTQPAAPGLAVENETPHLVALRRSLVWKSERYQIDFFKLLRVLSRLKEEGDHDLGNPIRLPL